MFCLLAMVESRRFASKGGGGQASRAFGGNFDPNFGILRQTTDYKIEKFKTPEELENDYLEFKKVLHKKREKIELKEIIDYERLETSQYGKTEQVIQKEQQVISYEERALDLIKEASESVKVYKSRNKIIDIGIPKNYLILKKKKIINEKQIIR